MTLRVAFDYGYGPFWRLVSHITGIHGDLLSHKVSIRRASVAERMSWAATRETTREEDIAYCLMGIFAVNMPLLYGEGPKAFSRLQEEIMKQSDDHLLFAWTGEHDAHAVHGLLADSPACFKPKMRTLSTSDPLSPRFPELDPYSMTNKGLHIQLRLRPVKNGVCLAILNCAFIPGEGASDAFYLIQLRDRNQYARILSRRLLSVKDDKHDKIKDVYVRQSTNISSEEMENIKTAISSLLARVSEDGPSSDFPGVKGLWPTCTSMYARWYGRNPLPDLM